MALSSAGRLSWVVVENRVPAGAGSSSREVEADREATNNQAPTFENHSQGKWRILEFHEVQADEADLDKGDDQEDQARRGGVVDERVIGPKGPLHGGGGYQKKPNCGRGRLEQISGLAYLGFGNGHCGHRTKKINANKMTQSKSTMCQKHTPPSKSLRSPSVITGFRANFKTAGRTPNPSSK